MLLFNVRSGNLVLVLSAELCATASLISEAMPVTSGYTNDCVHINRNKYKKVSGARLPLPALGSPLYYQHETYYSAWRWLQNHLVWYE
jgi:hypothetical protein